MTWEDNRIYVRDAVVEANHTVSYPVEYGSKAGMFLSGEPFFCQYDRDISAVPPGILIIPLLANLCPVAWISGADVYVEQLDKKFYHSLLKVKQSLSRLYPRMKFTGGIHVGKLTEEAYPVPATRSAAFFSGGVDSLATFIRHKEQNPYFITVWGADIGLHQPDVWNQVRQDNDAFGRAHGIESLFVKSNLHDFLNEESIAFNFGRFTHGWWPGVQHGIGMVGLCAPLAYTLGIANLYVASALPPKLAYSIPDGSNTTINNQIQWAYTKVQLDGEELTRQDKVSLIARFKRESAPDTKIRVCWSNQEYGNCGRCEKCLRTIAALLAEGLDPATAGFPMSEETYGSIRKQLPKWLRYNRLKAEYWDEIRVRSIENDSAIHGEARQLFDWLQRLDIPSFKKKRSVKMLVKDLIPHPLFLYIKKKRI